MHQVSNHPIPAEQLQNILDQAQNVKKYSVVTTLLCQVLAITCVCFILGGKPTDMIATALVSFCLYWINLGLSNYVPKKLLTILLVCS